MMTDDEIIEAVQAHKQGKIVQWRHPDWNDGKWIDWRFFNIEFFVSTGTRKPREFWITPNCDNRGWYVTNEPLIGAIHVREIIEK